MTHIPEKSMTRHRVCSCEEKNDSRYIYSQIEQKQHCIQTSMRLARFRSLYIFIKI
jgi:hypothetical protein